MQRVKMLRDVPGSLDGLTQQIFQQGQEYDMPDDMVYGLIQEGWVELVLETKPEPVALETKPYKQRGRRT
jgi:hypothetical protein